MRVVIQRVLEGRVRVEGEVVGSIGSGVVVLLGVDRGDGEKDVEELVQRVVHFRMFEDGSGRMGRSLLEAEAELLLVSQVTLCRQPRKGSRPSFDQAEKPDVARSLLLRFEESLRAEGVERISTGRFGARMQVEMVGDGPVTFVFESQGRLSQTSEIS
ncbi:MAG: D-aminoacyl-tRNA deacylase [Planctomycetota bacterium]|nr:D-aminoacyl-tRNA deacylase [Planctomycetota bacterium]